MRSNEYSLTCVQCTYTGDESNSITVCPDCGGQLDVRYDPLAIHKTLNYHSLKTTPLTATKYLRFLPIQDFTKIVSLNEGGTPLLQCKRLGKKFGLSNLYIKNEGANPTGVFKDRGSMVEVTKAIELESSAICCASTGNMAASVSAYAAMAGLPCYVVVPEGTPLGKLAQSICYGARIIQVRGTYADCVPLCEQMAKKHNFYLAGDYAFRLEGAKTCAYEIIEQLDWKVPDVVIVPLGCGTHMAGIWKGFQDFHTMGLIQKLPRMIGVQPEKVPTIVQAWKKNKERYIKVEAPSSIASAVSIGVPQDDIKALAAMRDSGGCGETATDEQILHTEQEMATLESLFVEPSSAIPCAVLEKLLQQNLIAKDDLIVCVSTGTGLKDPQTAISHIPDPPVIEPKHEEVDRYLELKLYEMTAARNKQQIVFNTKPTEVELANVLKKDFTLKIDSRILTQIRTIVCDFLDKGKSINFADMQTIIETSFNEFSQQEKVLEITDFHIEDSLHTKPVSEVQFLFHGKKSSGKGTGDGTFDAIVNALGPVIEKNEPHVSLTDYSVEIDTPGTSAVVKVKMTLIDQKGHKVISSSSSPDVIVASVRAFEKGYNILYWKTKLSNI